MNAYAQEIRQIGQDLASQSLTSINVMGYEKDFIEGYLNGIRKEHRTLQQNFGRVMIAVIKHYAEQYQKGCYDLRNEALCELCYKMAPIIEEFGGLPFI